MSWMVAETLDRRTSRWPRGDVAWALGVLLAALPMAGAIHLVTEARPGRTEAAVQIVGGLLAVLLLTPLAAYVLQARRAADPAVAAVIFLGAVCVGLAAIYLYRASFIVGFPADILIWAETDFVNDIVKWRVGYPLYTAQANNESFIYTPGAPLLTYALASALGRADSIACYRLLQLGYTLLAALLAVLCCRRLATLTGVDRGGSAPAWWSVAWLPMLFLVATNNLTNPFVHNLHNDALAQLRSGLAYWLLLRYVETRSARVLAAMAFVPAAGFFVKQNLAAWLVLYLGYLAVFDRPRSLRRATAFGVGALAGLSALVVGCYLAWGSHFIYWITVVRIDRISPVRGLHHVLEAWPYLVMGLIGGTVLLATRQPPLSGAWLVWLGLFSLAGYTSGAAWMRNHLGPACLLATVWFLVAIARFLRPWALATRRPPSRTRWIRVGTVAAIVTLLLNGLGVVRPPMRPLPADAYRYVREIEREFEGQRAADVLLDAGSWIYLREGIVMKDRSSSFGDRGLSDIGDFSGMRSRLQEKRYAKILVRNPHSPDLWYDHAMWRRSSGIREALVRNYREIRRIPAVSTDGRNADPRYLFGDVSVLVPDAR